jgi:hypothetical protein
VVVGEGFGAEVGDILPQIAQIFTKKEEGLLITLRLPDPC